MVYFVKVEEELKGFLYQLFSSYAIVNSFPVSDRFIFEYDIKFVMEKDQIRTRYDNAIILSNVVYEDEWKEDMLLRIALGRARELGISRKRTPTVIKDDFETSFRCTLFGLTPPTVVSHRDILYGVFDRLGTRKFRRAFFEASKTIPPARLMKAIQTYLTRVELSNSEYYQKKDRLRTKIQKNKDKVFKPEYFTLEADFVRYIEELLL
jgi:hypothetical protein